MIYFTYFHAVMEYEGGPKNNKNFFLEGRGAVLPSAPALCVRDCPPHQLAKRRP